MPQSQQAREHLHPRSQRKSYNWLGFKQLLGQFDCLRQYQAQVKNLV
jgi:hypothetical protein